MQNVLHMNQAPGGAMLGRCSGIARLLQAFLYFPLSNGITTLTRCCAHTFRAQTTLLAETQGTTGSYHFHLRGRKSAEEEPRMLAGAKAERRVCCLHEVILSSVDTPASEPRVRLRTSSSRGSRNLQSLLEIPRVLCSAFSVIQLHVLHMEQV
jgi:hypothetical protein